YTLSLKARKVSGSEGFLIKVRSLGPEDYIVWNLGGWHNEYHGLVSRLAQQDHLITRVEGKIETGRWYDIKVALRGTRVECYLDGKLVHRVDIPTRRTPQFFASAARDEQTGEIILKAVNPGNQPAQVDIKLRGVKHVSSTASSVVLTGKPADENSFDAPQHVVPVSETISNSSSQFHHTFKPHSFTVLRIGNATRR
ncbi:MAG TPA: alpha-L-arabinofuranosidase C-terminal domain-containing protein, partial [Clostridia bacterium]|nr:alpha-L-arabinofuranosidase C-terminal domain-containing protein [Clostridia bacterium]